MTIIAEETTTLPEGAILSVCRCKELRGKSYLTLIATHANKRVQMRLEEQTGTASLPTLLKLVRREIGRRRGMLTKKPDTDGPFSRKPHTIGDFVLEMALKDMFVFHDFNCASTNL